jgi:ornithine--oxo-acid transaminase
MSGIDLRAMVVARGEERFALHERHLNGPLVRILRTIGFDRDYVSGVGAHLFDADGNRYLDLLSGFGVFALGRSHPTVTAALRQVLDGNLPNLVQMDVSVLSGLLAERLAGLLPGLDKMFFCNSGAEAVEAAIKFARYATGRSRILSCEHGFHGLTYGALSLTDGSEFRDGFGPLLPGCSTVPFNHLPALEEALTRRDVAAFIVEPIQGKGVNMPDDSYLPEAARLCRKYGTLFVADEVQTGVGRTGRFVAIEHWDVEPDMVLLAKALSGGHVPIGAVAMRGWVFDRVFDRMDRAVVHGSTFSKTDLAMAAGLATLTALEEEGLVDQARRHGETLMADLTALKEKHGVIAEVRGKGLMIGVEIGRPDSLRLKAAWRFLDQVDKGLLCQMIVIPLFTNHRILTQVAGHHLPVLKLLPPYVISAADLAWIRDAFDRVLGDCQSLSGSVWPLIRSLAGNALRERTGTGRSAAAD